MTEKPTPKTYTLPMGQVGVRGRIISVRKFTGKDRTYHQFDLRLPAPDEFSHPQTIRIDHTSPVGRNGEEWEGIISVVGRTRQSEKVNNETGEVERVFSVFNGFQVVQ